MLPLSSDSLHVVDADGIKLGLRYIIGKRQDEYLSMMNELHKYYTDLAKVHKRSEGKCDDEISVDDSEKIFGYDIKILSYNKKLIDFFVDEVDGKKDFELSSKLRKGDIEKVVAAIRSALPILNGNEIAESKN